MRKSVKFKEAALENKARFIEALPYIADSRRIRIKPRSNEESIGIFIATAELVQQAYQSGRLVRKEPKGFVLNAIKR